MANYLQILLEMCRAVTTLHASMNHVGIEQFHSHLLVDSSLSKKQA